MGFILEHNLFAVSCKFVLSEANTTYVGNKTNIKDKREVNKTIDFP